MKQITISDIQRNLHKLSEFDIIEVIDKKRDKVKGYFLDSRYAFYVQDIIQKEKSRKKRDHSPAGALKSYADPDKRSQEEEAWKKSIVKKYSK